MNSDIFSFCQELQQLVASRRSFGRNGKVFDGVGALSSVNNIITIRNLCVELKPERTLEVGFSFGGSGLAFTASHRDLGHAPQHQHLALDPFQTAVWDDAGTIAVERAGLSSLNEGQQVEYEIVTDRGKQSAGNLKVK